MVEKDVVKTNGVKDEALSEKAEESKKKTAREKHNEYMRRYRKKNKEKYNEYMREYQRKNREKVNEANRKSYFKNNHNERQKQRYAEDDELREDKIRRAKEWNEKHAEERREYMREYMREYRKRKAGAKNNS